jgi:hypothetical protein
MMKQLLFLSALCFLLTGCKKEDDTTDYRDEFIGEYDFEYHYVFTVLASPPYVSLDTTIYYTGDVTALGDSSISVDDHNGGTYTLEVDQFGTISYCSLSNAGSVGNDDFIFQYNDNACTGGPLGANYSVQLLGSKQ